LGSVIEPDYNISPKIIGQNNWRIVSVPNQVGRAGDDGAYPHPFARFRALMAPGQKRQCSRIISELLADADPQDFLIRGTAR
jgi:hypothetical protein